MKQKILKISPHIILDIYKKGLGGDVIEVINPIPEDSFIVRTLQGETFGDIYVVIQSESFPVLNDGDLIPEVKRPEFSLISRGEKK